MNNIKILKLKTDSLDNRYVNVDGDTMTGEFITSGGRAKNLSTYTDTDTMEDTDEVVVCNKATTFTLTLPTHNSGQEIRIINKGAGAVTLSPTSGNIKGSATKVLNQWESLILISDGTDWI